MTLISTPRYYNNNNNTSFTALKLVCMNKGEDF